MTIAAFKLTLVPIAHHVAGADRLLPENLLRADRFFCNGMSWVSISIPFPIASIVLSDTDRLQLNVQADRSLD